MKMQNKLEKLLSQKKSSEREVGIMLLKEVKNFAKSSISRRKYLLSYFGEKYDPNIHNDQVWMITQRIKRKN